MTKTGRYIDYEGPPMQQAIEYARQHCAQLVTKMDDESKTRIAQVIADGIENKIGIDGLERDLRATFMDMSGTRAEMIARTETCDALEQAFMDRAEELGIDGKEWVVLSPCPICEENAAAGPIGIDETFPSGDIRPPAHPNCRCALSPVLLNKGGK
jgi:SPP1 gp7 family putative phage head morphogenesis protein